ncbi:hypothetical protein Tco_0404629 [Tanacetum coccineum]
MNQKVIRQVTARDEKWVPTKEIVKIGTSNVRLETTVPQKEETFQVIIDVIKNSTCYKAFIISAEVPEIFMQQFWHTVKKVVVFKEKTLLKFHMISLLLPSSLILAIKCISGKTASNDRLRKSRIDILWGMFYKENVDYPKLIWEDFVFHIDHRMEKQRRRENMIRRFGFRKSMSLTEAAEEEAARQAHATHERIVNESDPEPARRRPSGIAFRDTSSVSKKMSPDPSQKLKGVPDESTITHTTSSEGTSIKPGVLNEEKVTFEAKDDVTLDWVSEQESQYSKEDQGDDENIPLESTYKDEEKKDDDDDKIHGDEQVNGDEDEEMTNAEDADTRNGDEEITDAAKAEEVKDDIKKSKLPPSGSILSVSLGFGNQFLNLSSDTSLIGIVKDTTDAEINSLLDVQIQQEISHIQSPSVLTVPVFMISKPLVLTPIPETSSIAPATTLLPRSNVSSISHVLLQTTTTIPTPPITTKAPPITTILDPIHAIIQRLSVLEKDVQELKEVDCKT